MTRVLICGSRNFGGSFKRPPVRAWTPPGIDFADKQLVDRFYEFLDKLVLGGRLPNHTDVVIHGDCPTGADQHAQRWAYLTGIMQIIAFPANFELRGRKDGPLRNTRMLRLGQPDFVVAAPPSPDSNGTRDMVMQAEREGLVVHRFGW